MLLADVAAEVVASFFYWVAVL